MNHHILMYDMIYTLGNSIVEILTIHACKSVNEVVIQEIIAYIKNEDVVFLKVSHSIGLQKFIHYFGMNR